MYMWSQKVRRLDDTLLPRLLWLAGRGGAGKRDPRRSAAVSIIPLGSRSGGGSAQRLEGLLLRLALAGRKTLCSSAVSGVMLPIVPDLAEKRKKTGMERSDRELLCTPLADFGPGPETAAERRSAGRGVYFLRLSPQTSGQARTRPRRRRQDGEFAFYASRSRLRVWLGGGPGGGGGARSWIEAFFAMPLPTTFGLARRGRWRGAQLDREFAVYASRRRLRASASPGGGGGGGDLVCLFADFSSFILFFN